MPLYKAMLEKHARMIAVTAEPGVLLMPTDPQRIYCGSAFVRSTRPATDSRYRFSNVPLGDYRLFVLRDEPEGCLDAAITDEVRGLGISLSITSGPPKAQDVEVRSPAIGKRSDLLTLQSNVDQVKWVLLPPGLQV
jgi:hypothetical protein